MRSLSIGTDHHTCWQLFMVDVLGATKHSCREGDNVWGKENNMFFHFFFFFFLDPFLPFLPLPPFLPAREAIPRHHAWILIAATS
jgi:hypothetical protein